MRDQATGIETSLAAPAAGPLVQHYGVMLDALLALGLILSTTSQLRVEGAAVGPGEICLAIWSFLMLTGEIGRIGPPITPVLGRLLTFWMLFACAMCLGTMTGYAIGDIHDPVWFAHDVFAYSLMAVLSCLWAVEPGAGTRVRRIAWLIAICGAISLVIQACQGFGLIEFPGFDPWEWDRLRGLSDNSNQLALSCAVIGLLSLHLAETSTELRKKAAAIACMIAAIVVGRLTKSDAFLLVILAAGPIYVPLKFRTWLTSSQRTMNLRSATAWIIVLMLPAVLAVAVPFAQDLVIAAETMTKEMTRGGGKKDTEDSTRLRFYIWKSAIGRGIESGMLGLGPGPHLEIPPSLVEKSHDEPKSVARPQKGLAPNFEAHNTVLDLFMQGGIPLLVSFGWIVGSALTRSYGNHLDAITTMLCGLIIFSMFHFIFRHPIIWFAIVYSLVLVFEGDPAPNFRPTRLSHAR